jgi:hypothetical protein
MTMSPCPPEQAAQRRKSFHLRDTLAEPIRTHPVVTSEPVKPTWRHCCSRLLVHSERRTPPWTCRRPLRVRPSELSGTSDSKVGALQPRCTQARHRFIGH